MRYVAAYMLSSFSGKEPTSADIEKILGSVGIEADNAKISKVIQELKGKNIDELIASGRGKLSSMPVGGSAAVAAVAAPTASSAEPVVEKKEEKKPVKEESESDDDLGFGLFD